MMKDRHRFKMKKLKVRLPRKKIDIMLDLQWKDKFWWIMQEDKIIANKFEKLYVKEINKYKIKQETNQ
jgi:hypothetical protein